MTVKYIETYDGTTITQAYEAESVAELINLMQELQKERRRSEEQDRIESSIQPVKVTTWQERLQAEYEELQKKTDKLDLFVHH